MGQRPFLVSLLSVVAILVLADRISTLEATVLPAITSIPVTKRRIDLPSPSRLCSRVVLFSSAQDSTSTSVFGNLHDSALLYIQIVVGDSPFSVQIGSSPSLDPSLGDFVSMLFSFSRPCPPFTSNRHGKHEHQHCGSGLLSVRLVVEFKGPQSVQRRLCESVRLEDVRITNRQVLS